MRAACAAAALGVALWLPPTPSSAEAVDYCQRCHAEEEEPELSEPVEEWRRSVHAEAEVSCDACHGGDPFQADGELAMDEDAAGFVGSPGWAEVPEFCGACHEDVLDGYSESVMAGLIEYGVRVAVCTTCHMTVGHAIVRSSAREILTAERCGQCHDAQRAFALRDLLEETGGRIASVESRLQAIHGTIDTSRLDREVREIRQRAVVIAHTYDRQRIAEVGAVADERLEAVVVEIAEMGRESERRRRVGIAVVAFFAVASLGAARLERKIRKRGKR